MWRISRGLVPVVVIATSGLVILMGLYMTSDAGLGFISSRTPVRIAPGEISSMGNNQTPKSNLSNNKSGNLESWTVSVKRRFEERKRKLDDGCRKFRFRFREARIKKGVKKRKLVYHGDFVAVPDRVFYCGIEKVGSTEWESNIFKRMSLHNITVIHPKDWYEALRRKKTNPYTNVRTRFLFVREPYGRLISAFVDKLFTPNKIFWEMHGKVIVKRFRPQPSRLSLHCGHDVTFAEFVDYVIESEMRNGTQMGGSRKQWFPKPDNHFTPQFKHCHLCEFPYNFVGHLETLEEDRDFLLKEMESPVQAEENFPKRNLEHQVLQYIRKYDPECISKDEALRRLWQKLKIRGHLSSSMDFPLTPAQSANISVHEFTEIARSHIEKASQTLGLASLKGNRLQALKEAFATVSLSKKKQLAQVLHWDFQLFGYDPYPPAVFGCGDVYPGSNTSRSLFDLYS